MLRQVSAPDFSMASMPNLASTAGRQPAFAAVPASASQEQRGPSRAMANPDFLAVEAQEMNTRLSILESALRRLDGQHEATERRLKECTDAEHRLETQRLAMEAKCDQALVQVEEVRKDVTYQSVAQQRLAVPASDAPSAAVVSADIQGQLEAMAISMGQTAGKVEARLDQALHVAEQARRKELQKMEAELSALRVETSLTKGSLESQLTTLKSQVGDMRQQSVKELEAGLEMVCRGVVARLRELLQVVDMQVEERLQSGLHEDHVQDGVHMPASSRFPAPQQQEEADVQGLAQQALDSRLEAELSNADAFQEAVKRELKSLKDTGAQASKDLSATRRQVSALGSQLERYCPRSDVNELSSRLLQVAAEAHDTSVDVERIEALEIALHQSQAIQSEVRKQVEDLKDSISSITSVHSMTLPRAEMDVWTSAMEDRLRGERQQLETSLAALDAKLRLDCTNEARAYFAAEAGETSVQIAALVARTEKLEGMTGSLEEQVGSLARDTSIHLQSSIIESSRLAAAEPDQQPVDARQEPVLVQDDLRPPVSPQRFAALDARLNKLEEVCGKLQSIADPVTTRPECAETGGSPAAADSTELRLSWLEEQVSKLKSNVNESSLVAEARQTETAAMSTSAISPSNILQQQAVSQPPAEVGSLSLTASALSASMQASPTARGMQASPAAAVVHQPQTPTAAGASQATVVLALSWLPGADSSLGVENASLAGEAKDVRVVSPAEDGSQLATCVASTLGLDVMRSSLQASPGDGQPSKATFWLASPPRVPPLPGSQIVETGGQSQPVAESEPAAAASSGSSAAAAAPARAAALDDESLPASPIVVAKAATTASSQVLFSQSSFGTSEALGLRRRLEDLEGSAELLHSGLERVERRMLHMEESILGLSGQMPLEAQLGDLSPVTSRARLSASDPGPWLQDRRSSGAKNRHSSSRRQQSSASMFLDASTLNESLPTANRNLSRSTSNVPTFHKVAAARSSGAPSRTAPGTAVAAEPEASDSDYELPFFA